MTEEAASRSISMFSSTSLLTLAEEIITRNNFSFIFNNIVTNSFTHCIFVMYYISLSIIINVIELCYCLDSNVPDL